MTIYKAKDYDLTRKSESKVFTHAVIFRNVSGSVDPSPGATFHVSLKLAEKEMNRMQKIDWLVPLHIVEVEVA